MEKKTKAPPVREATARQRIAEVLRSAPAGISDISVGAGVSERQVPVHLEHLKKSLKASGEKLVVKPAQCRECGFEFTKRERKSKPGRCPVCRSTRIAEPVFSIE